MALSPERVAEIEGLLREQKISKREISRTLKVSRVTIDRIEKRMLFPEETEPKIRILHFDQGDNYLADEIKPEFERCKGCGGMQQKYVPCLVCQLRKRQMEAYDCYMAELLTPAIVSPLSEKYKCRVSPQKKAPPCPESSTPATEAPKMEPSEKPVKAPPVIEPSPSEAERSSCGKPSKLKDSTSTPSSERVKSRQGKRKTRS